MRAIVMSTKAEGGLALREVSAPRPADDELVVRMHAASLNYGTIAYLDGALDNQIRGSDGAGTVVRAAANGTGPAVGDRIAFATPHGTWAEFAAVPVAFAAHVPDGVSDATAAAIPGAGLTALQAVRRLSGPDGLVGVEGSVRADKGVNADEGASAPAQPLAGTRVLVTGAAGGVGVFAIQLLVAAGAEVIAWVGRPERGAGLGELGASRVITSAIELGDQRVDAILDTVGGSVLTDALGCLADHGLALNIGFTSGEASLINVEALRRMGPGRRLEFFVCTDVSGASLEILLAEVAAQRVRVPLAPAVPWERYAEAVAALLERRVSGKVVLSISGAESDPNGIEY
ncbi:zinc-binding dehydrogenase [Mycetocola saprophilus]|uniref:zinc-binding dehydrogenase n=1 Tax=Mycetocola saprophilus TaxID=76636 RepID=UPI003BEF5338